ncbi:uncharacterized protein LOC131019917 [Salvia miltiorrhiza]|uniref:uncharacterized protein LOC131019917 n=1 Tax=Salvia miltiorrhiza TaxID=226208 RepID=UPI0025AB8EB3|nr:uncharacterized protein LOC131019917 [Salvia miltiorrhiza]
MSPNHRGKGVLPLTMEEETPSQLQQMENHVDTLPLVDVAESSDAQQLRAEDTKKRKTVAEPSQYDARFNCSICRSVSTGSGPHRPCFLECGHVFGFDCITTWLAPGYQPFCPTCKKMAHPSDVRCLYGTTNREELLKEAKQRIEEGEKRIAQLRQTFKNELELSQLLFKCLESYHQAAYGLGSPDAMP